jgi:uncharacterized small protein (DUF1192 family)
MQNSIGQGDIEMKKTMIIFMVVLNGFLYNTLGAQTIMPVNMDGRGDQPIIQLALLLDTSNSMDGLINQAKSQLWKIVAQTAKERRNGRMPILEVALYEYGNDSLSILSGYVRQVVPFTTDLDYLSQKLFELDTNGGSEYCGKVMISAARQLDWSRDDQALKLMFIAGNEPFDQGPVDYVRAAESVMGRDIKVNTIFCGDYEEGRYSNWAHGAQITGGSYMNINSDYEQAYIYTPYDDRISQLNMSLNETYLGYGAQGEMKKEVQKTQDENAKGLNMGSLLDRAAVKSSKSYSNSEWDLVDAYAEGAVELEDMPAEALPAPMVAMDNEERRAYVVEKQEERLAIQEEIARLSEERETYLAEQTAAEPDESTLDSAMLNAIRQAAEEKGFTLEK